jgi:Kef-type K+ transport system membrane component KefB
MNFDLSFLKISLLTALGLLSVIGFYFGRTARLVRLPSLIGYMVLGVILGPSLFNILDEPALESLSFLTQLALGFVAFSIGTELNMASVKKLGVGIVSIIFAESFGAFFVVTAGIYLLTRDLPFALIFGAMAPASAPAGTVAVIQEYKAKGNLTKALYAVVGFDDGLAILIFGFAAALAKNLLIAEAAGGPHENVFLALSQPAEEIFFSFLLGAFVGFVISILARNIKNSRELLILIFGVVLVATGLSNRWHLSLILTNMVAGFVLVNTRQHSVSHNVNEAILSVMPLLFVLFFCLAGAHLEVSTLPTLGLVGLVYILTRSAGLIGGARLGAMFGKVDENVKKYIGLGILSQAGVAIGLSLIIKHELDVLGTTYNIPHAAKIGVDVLTTVTATCIFFEIVGPILTKVALRKAGEIPHEQ